MTYPEVQEYLNSFVNYEKITEYPYKESLKLEQVKDFLNTLGNPEDDLRCIHVAGTKGKGSTCAFIAYILKEAGYKVGLYTSPHLWDFRERIRILEYQGVKVLECQGREDFEGIISREEIADLINNLRPKIEEYNVDSKYGPLTFFEVYTALAFLYFKEKKVDFAVLETGLGGRLDATNTVNALVSVITPISYEHTDKLGNTLKEITTEKAGIIKGEKAIVISAPQTEEVMDVIKNKCKEVGAKLYGANNKVSYETMLLGKHQQINANVAVAAVEALKQHNITIDSAAIKGGIANTVWPGRCEVVSKNPFIVLDGAQNVASSEAIKETIRKEFGYKRLILVLGVSQDKDIKGICRELSEIADEIILTKANNPRAAEPRDISLYLTAYNLQLTANIKEALDLAKSKAGSDGLILITGSLFVVGEARELLRQTAELKVLSRQ